MVNNRIKFDRNKVKDFSKKVRKQVPNSIFYPAGINDGCTAWRMRFVEEALNFNKRSNVQITNILQPSGLNNTNKVNSVYTTADSVLIQRPVSEDRLNLIKNLQIVKNAISRLGHTPFRLVIDIDDVIKPDAMPNFCESKIHFDDKKWDIFKECVKRSDELHVASPYMRDFYKNEIGVDHITYKPNLMPRHLYDHHNVCGVFNRNTHSKKPRILWAGSFTHIDVNNKNGGDDDFSHIIDFIRKTVDTYQWVFFGAIPNGMEDIRDKIETHSWIGIYYYPRKVLDLCVDVMIAPLQDNEFNKSKSNIKLIEGGALGIPVICQDLEPYKEAPLKFNTGEELSDQLKLLISNESHYKECIEKQKVISDRFFIEDEENLDMLVATLYNEIGSPNRLKIESKMNSYI